jgi:hypothetical protein
LPSPAPGSCASLAFQARPVLQVPLVPMDSKAHLDRWVLLGFLRKDFMLQIPF